MTRVGPLLGAGRSMSARRRHVRRAGALIGLGTLATVMCTLAFTAAPAGAAPTFLGGLNVQVPVSTTVPDLGAGVPGNGDLNPYGVARVPSTIGLLHRDDILVSNFNNFQNQQGTGSTIVQIRPDGTQTVFAHLDTGEAVRCPGGIGLTTALAVLNRGYVVVGSLPTSDGTFSTAQAGCLIVLNSLGQPVTTISGGPINGPWDLTALNFGEISVLFVTNVLNGTVANSPKIVNGGAVDRIVLDLDGATPHVLFQTVIASGFAERTDPTALVVGPTGVGFGGNGTLYVADTASNRITGIPDALFRRSDAGTGFVVSANGVLNGPLGLALAHNGDILTVNGGDGNIVETTPFGAQVANRLLDATGSPPGNGALFGLALAPRASGVYFVDDNNNNLNLLHR